MGEILGSALGIMLIMFIVVLYRKIKYNIYVKRNVGKLNKIKASLDSEDPNELLKKLFDILYKDPNNYEAHYTRAILWMKTDNYENAIISLNKCLELNKDVLYSKKVKLKRGECYYHDKNYKLAIEDFEEVKEVDDVKTENMYKECLRLNETKTNEVRIEEN